jgi:DNA polymerase-3 subunit delta'
MNWLGIIGHQGQLNKIEMMFKKKRLPPVLLFNGPSGIGKKEISFRIIKSLFCQEDFKPCLTCSPCLQIREKSFPDFLELAPKGKGIIPIGDFEGKEIGTVRWLISSLSKGSFTGRYGVIIDGMDKISLEGQNALLKLIEEPPLDTQIIILSSNKAQIIPTILSRCFSLDFYPLKSEEVAHFLKQKKSEQAGFLSSLAGGSLEIALLLSQEKILNQFMDLVQDISCYLNEPSREDQGLNLNLIPLKNEVGLENFVNIMINMYRFFWQANIKQQKMSENFERIKIYDQEKIAKLIKILLALKQKSHHNLNINYYFKGMIYNLSQLNLFKTLS